MYTSIVVGTDGSDTAREAVARAVDLARLCGARVNVVTAYGGPTAGTALVAAAGMPLPDGGADIASAAEAVLEKALAGIDTTGLDISTTARTGEASNVLLTVADESGADVIVVGNRGLSGARRLLGSVPNRVAHRATCAVHIVHTC